MENQINSGIDSFQLFDLLAIFRRHRYLFLLSVLVCCGISFIIIWTTPNTYLRTASVMIKDDSSMPELSTVFSDQRTTVLSRNSNVKNEVEAFQSPQLIQEVIQRLHLMVNYSQEKKMRVENLYSRSPVEALFPDSEDSKSLSFTLEFDPDHSFILSNFMLNDKAQKNEKSIRGNLNDTIETPIGKVVILPTSNFGPDWNYVPLGVSKNTIHNETRGYIKKLKAVLANKDNAIIRLELTDEIIERAEDFLNKLLEIYDEKWLMENNKAAVSASKFFEEQLQIIKKEVDALDDSLQRYKSRHLVTDVRSAGLLYTTQSSESSLKVMEINSQLSIARFIKKQLDDNSDVYTVLSVAGLNNSAIEMQINTYNEMLMQREKYILNSSENNYQVLNLNERLKTLRFSITQSVNNTIESLNLQLRGLQSQQSQMKGQIASNPVQEMKLQSIEREHQAKVNQYVGMLQNKLDNDKALVVSVTNTRIISTPSGSNIPVAPKAKVIMMVAFFIGLVIPAGFIWGKENLNITIREKKDLESLSVPLLGIISLVNKVEKDGGLLLVQENGKDALNETFRMVRTNLDNICAKNQKVIMFTSLEPGSGKTFTSLNLAMTLALANRKVALLDIDFRTAALSLLISMPEMGMVDFLNGRTSDESYVIKKDFYYTGFDVIPVGVIPPNPTEMLMRDRFKVLIEKLRTRYDFIILDSTPLDMVADATIVAKYVDISVFVVREGHTDRRKIPILEETYKRGHFKNMMLLLNGSKQEIYFNKHHSFYSEKVKHVALLPREAYSQKVTKYLTEGQK